MDLKRVWGKASDRLLIVGLTGGIAAGKSEVTRELSRLGAHVIDADEITREVTRPGTEAFDAIVKEFGRSVLDREGGIDRASLSDIVFSNEKKRKALNAITHPRILARMVEDMNEYAESLTPDVVPAVVIDAALIVDVGVSSAFDRILVVTTDDDIRIGRIVRERGMSEREARERIESQVSDSERLKAADVVIANNGTLEELRSEVARAWSGIAAEARARYS